MSFDNRFPTRTLMILIELSKVSNVELGGATVFPALGVTLWPKKGSAAFWYNLHKNGEGDELTRHAACPVLKGTKWGKDTC
jgi:prolyl 4-hydroxylase